MSVSTPRTGETFEQWFARQEFRYFSAREFTSYFSAVRRGVKNSEPPRYLWHRIVPTLRLADRLREHLGKPLIITSSYRSPAYNRAVGSSNPPDPRALLGYGSQHPRFTALDIYCKGLRPRTLYQTLLAWRRTGEWQGGLGRYSSFVHIDTRPYNATWGG